MPDEGDLLSARQAAADLGFCDRTARRLGAKAVANGDRRVAKAGKSWVAPRWWWRQLLETPDPAARRPRKQTAPANSPPTP